MKISSAARFFFPEGQQRRRPLGVRPGSKCEQAGPQVVAEQGEHEERQPTWGNTPSPRQQEQLLQPLRPHDEQEGVERNQLAKVRDFYELKNYDLLFCFN